MYLYSRSLLLIYSYEVIQGTHADLSDPVERWKEQEWREYEFKVKPGDVARRPPWISPYHYRLDWLMWCVRARTHTHTLIYLCTTVCIQTQCLFGAPRVLPRILHTPITAAKLCLRFPPPECTLALSKYPGRYFTL